MTGNLVQTAHDVRHGRHAVRESSIDIVSVFVFLAGLALVTVVCVVVSRRLGGHARSDDHAASLHAQQRAQAQRDAYEQPGSPFSP